MKKLIKNCNIIDGISSCIKRNCWILFDSTCILSIGSMNEGLPHDIQTCIDAKNAYLLPGMINLHVHIQRRHLHYKGEGVFRQGAAHVENSPDTKRMLWAVRNAWDELRNGATTIRDVSSKNRVNIDLRTCIEEGIIRGPRVIAAGMGIAVTGGHETHRYQGAVEADGVDEIRKAVRFEIKQGADLIKFMGSGGIGGMPEHELPSWEEITVEELRAGIEEAHRRGKDTTIHAMGTNPVLNALNAGIDGIEHGTNLNTEALDFMSDHDVYLVPTTSGITAVAEREQESGSKETAKIMFDQVVYPQYESIYNAYKRGIRIGCGTDTLGDMVRELELFHACGIPTEYCIKTATSIAASICRKEDLIGTIEVGKLADLLLVTQNPLEDLSALRSIEMIYKSGELVTTNWMCKF